VAYEELGRRPVETMRQIYEKSASRLRRIQAEAGAYLDTLQGYRKNQLHHWPPKYART